jgi:membrane associated rhomboid family serine protease
MGEGLQGQLVTLLLVGLNVAFSLLAFRHYREGLPPDDVLFIPDEVRQGRNLGGLLRSHVSHADGAHLAFNMVTLFFFGPVVEAWLGPLSLLTIYVLAGVGSTLATFAVHRNDPGYRALGASGSVSGVLFAAIVLAPSMDLYVAFVPIPIPAPIFAVAYLALSFVAARRRLGNVGHEAHIGGALTGLLLAGARVGFGPLLESFEGRFG